MPTTPWPSAPAEFSEAAAAEFKMKVLITPNDGPADAALEQLTTWSAEGLLDKFVWWLGRESDGELDLTVVLVSGGISTEMPLARALEGVESEDVDLVAFATTFVGGEFPLAFGQRIDDFEAASQAVLAFQADRPLTTTVIVAPPDVAQPIPEGYFLARRHARVLVASEDRPAPSQANHLIEEDEDATPHAAHALASLCDLWASNEPTDEPVFDQLYLEPIGALVAPVRLARCFTRVVDLENFPDELATEVFRVGEGWPNPDRKRFIRAIDPVPLVGELTRQYLRKHREILDLSDFQPTPKHPPESMTLWEAIRLLLKIFFDFILHLPQRLVELVSRRVADQVNRLAGHLEGQLEKLGAGGRQVKRVGQDGQQGSDFDPIRPAERTGEKDPSGAWRDLAMMSYALIDGSDHPEAAWDELMRTQDKRTIVEHPRAVVPDPSTPLPTGTKSIFHDDPVRVCDPLFLEPRFLPSDNPLSLRYVKPVSPDVEVVAASPAESASERVENADDAIASVAVDEGAEESVEPKTDAAGVATALKDSNTVSQASNGSASNGPAPESPGAGSNGAGPSDKEEDDDIARRRAEWVLRWVEPHQGTAVWSVGASIATAYTRACDEAELAEQGPDSDKTREELKEVDERIDAALQDAAKSIRKRWLIGVPAAIALTVAIYFGLVGLGLPIFVRIPAILAVLFLWVLVGAYSLKRHSANVEEMRREREGVFRAAIDRERLGVLRRYDRDRLLRRYREYRDWAEVIGWFAHFPWLESEDDNENPVEAIPHRPHPASFIVAGVDTKDKRQQIVQRERHALFKTGWMNAYFADVEKRLMGDYVRAYEYVEDEDFERPDPMADVTDQKDSPRRYFLDGSRTGDGREIDVEGGNPLSTRLLDHLGQLTPDDVAADCHTAWSESDGGEVASRSWESAADFYSEILGSENQAFLPQHWASTGVADAAIATTLRVPPDPSGKETIAGTAVELRFRRPLRCLYRRIEFSGVFAPNALTSNTRDSE